MASTTYDHFEKTCKNGFPQYYGVTIDPVTGQEVKHEMNGSDWVAAGQSQGYESMSLGCPHAGSFISIGGKPTIVIGHIAPLPKPKSPASTKIIAAQQGKKMGVSDGLISKVQSLIPHRNTFQMEIRNMGGNVADPNNMYEILAEYGRVHQSLPTPSRAVKATVSMVPKSGFDIGGIAGAFGDLVSGIADGVNNANVANYLSAFASQYAQYMNTDLGAINATRNATATNRGPWGGYGPQGALDMLLQFKNTSWAGLKSDITNYVNSHQGTSVPQSVKDYWQQQDTLEQSLRSEIANGSTGGLNNGTQYSNQVPSPGVRPNGSGPTSNGTTGGSSPSGAAGFDFMKWLPWIVVGVLAVIVIIIMVSMMSGKSKKSKAA